MKEYIKLIKIHPVILYKDDLFELENIILTGLSFKRGELKIDVSVDDYHITGNSFEEVFSQSLPKQTDTVEISGHKFSENLEKDLSISINFYTGAIYCYISSYDETWFLGIISKLKTFFLKHKPWYAWLSGSIPLIMGILSGWSFLLAIWGYSVGLRWSLIFLLLVFIISTTITILTIKNKLFPHVKIFLSEKTHQKINYELIAIIIALVSLVFTIVNVVIAFTRI